MKAGWMNFALVPDVIPGEVQLPCLQQPPEILFNIVEINIHSWICLLMASSVQ